MLSRKIGELLHTLYEKRLNALRELKLGDLLKKNPYLYRALGLNRPCDLIEQLLLARVSSSDETIFGNDFFEPLAVFAAQHGQAGAQVTVGAGAGQDIAVETAREYLAISVKSGTNIFNSQSEKGQSAEFSQLQARLKKLGKMFRPIIGYGYGRKAVPKKPSPVERLAGQKFWALLTGETDFYLRISRAMEAFATEHAADFRKALEVKESALLREFMIDFVTPAGEIQWDAVVAFSSSEDVPKVRRNRKAAAP
jgi:hypothetical protein